jgi:prepilin-type N-terminal cleavage/methylation domain-containing protein
MTKYGNFKKSAPGQKGLSLVETLVAVAILGTAVAGFAAGLSAGSISVRDLDEIAVSQGLAQSQAEYTKSYAFTRGVTTYPVLAAPAGYTLSVAVSAVPGADTDIQKISIAVSHGGQVTETLEDYKVNR